MIGQLTGTIVTENRNPLIIDVSGVGYRVFVPPLELSRLPKNSIRTLTIYTSVKDDAIDLYGFLTFEELGLFELLLTVSGIGPKTGLLVINRGVELVTKAIMQSDVTFFMTIPRLGKKNAQKIIIELKSKLGSMKDLDLTESETSETKDIMDALTSMGFEKSEVLAAIKKLSPDYTTTEQKLKAALKLLGR